MRVALTQPSISLSRRPCVPARPQGLCPAPDATPGILFDPVAAQSYLYPCQRDKPPRQYQRDIVRTALFYNTLVSLPTGLGKTLIAAVVMYNYFRWFPNGKVVFAAPTRPLVAQQMRACHEVMGMPQGDTCELTGGSKKGEDGSRRELWATHRCFFCTPQTFLNDLKSGVADAQLVSCVVFDEAHKASGSYAYCQVVEYLQNVGARYRLLALSATPGDEQEKVEKVLRNLRVSRVEFRTEEDLAQYAHARALEVMKIAADVEQQGVEEQLVAVMRPLMEEVSRLGGLQNGSERMCYQPYCFLAAAADITAGKRQVRSKGQCLEALDRLRTISRGLDLLHVAGMKQAYAYFAQQQEKLQLRRGTTELSEVVRVLRARAERGAAGSPKLEAVVAVVSSHFKRGRDRAAAAAAAAGGAAAAASSAAALSSTRAIVFSSSRESVKDIMEQLRDLRSFGVIPSEFVGQSEASNKAEGKDHARGQTQKEQTAILAAFRRGEVNTLVATCIGEEGLDVSEVDLVLFYDCVNVTRMVQRMGRCGRSRNGACVILASVGKEAEAFEKTLRKFDALKKMLRQPAAFRLKDDVSPKMLPSGYCPQERMQAVHASPWRGDEVGPNGGKKRKRKAGGAAGGGGGAGTGDCDAEGGAAVRISEVTEAERALLRRFESDWRPSHAAFVHRQGEAAPACEASARAHATTVATSAVLPYPLTLSFAALSTRSVLRRSFPSFPPLR